ncbi:MAG: hypothetical protein R3B70_02045 [Polyangiaceae bacterium]
MTRNQALLRALGGKLNLGVLGAAMSAAAFLQSGAVLLAGMAAFLGLVTRDVVASGRRLHCFSPRIPDASTFHNIAVRNVIDGLHAAQRERMEALLVCPDDILTMIDGTLRTVVQLELAAVRLARRTERMHAYLSRKDVARERELLYAAELAARHARSPDERESYEAAARSCAVEVETLGSIELGMRVAIAKLENIRATLAVVPPRLVKLCAASADLADTLYFRLGDDLRGASTDLSEVEERFHTLSRSGGGEPCYVYDIAAPGASSCLRVTLGADPSEDLPDSPEEPARAAHTA